MGWCTMESSRRRFGVTSSGFVADKEMLAAGVKELAHFDPRNDSMEVCAELVFLAMLEVMEAKMALSRETCCAANQPSESRPPDTSTVRPSVLDRREGRTGPGADKHRSPPAS
jgi:hypothetical protein